MFLPSMSGHLIGVAQDSFWTDTASGEIRTKQAGHGIIIIVISKCCSHTAPEKAKKRRRSQSSLEQFFMSSSPRFGERNRRLTITQSQFSGGSRAKSKGIVKSIRGHLPVAPSITEKESVASSCSDTIVLFRITSFLCIVILARHHTIQLHFGLIALAIRHPYALTLQPPA